MKKNIFFAALVVAIGLEILDLSISGTYKLGTLALISIALTFILDFKIKNLPWTSIVACAAFAIVAASHLNLIKLGTFSEQSYLTISMLIGGMSLTRSFREIMG